MPTLWGENPTQNTAMKSVCVSAQSLLRCYWAASRSRRHKSLWSILSCSLGQFSGNYVLFVPCLSGTGQDLLLLCWQCLGRRGKRGEPKLGCRLLCLSWGPQTHGKYLLLPWVQGNIDEGFFSFQWEFQAVGLLLLCVSTCTTLTPRNAFGDLQDENYFIPPCLISNKCASTDRIARVCLKLDVFLLLNVTQLKLLWICIQSLAFLFLFHVP